MLNKEKLRKDLREKLLKLDNEKRNEKSQLCFKNLIELLKAKGLLSNEIVLGLFAPLNDEINIVESIAERVGTLAFPSVNEQAEMIFRESNFEDLVENTSFKVKILEPSLKSKVVTPDVLLVPGLAFGRKGERLGRGRGYYDKYLQNYKGITIGLSLDEQLVPEIPMEEHDCYLSWVVTDREVIEI
ncbi:MAG: 5-formyltetrahydrofolate cyclo-ligase [Halobacteriovorax sp. JY17]|nr:MAG: 5-formyltetrahydrofolate cyclo-ligase [Halobacteriovorax sp. JY17]